MFFLTIQVVHQFFHVFLVELLLPGLLQELHTAVAGRFDAAAQGAHDGTGFVQREHDGGGVLAACQKEEASTKSSQAMIVEWPCKANARQTFRITTTIPTKTLLVPRRQPKVTHVF
jgi:hypothetical protein